MIKSAAIFPHSPLSIPGVGGSQASIIKKTIAGMEDCAQEISHNQPETLVIISPHGPMRYDKFTINLEDQLRGSFSDFGGDSQEYVFENNTLLARKLLYQAKSLHFPVEVIREPNLDHGTMVPLYFLAKKLETKPLVVPLTFTALDWKMHFGYGQELGKTLHESEDSVSIIASGDLSHRLTENSPAGFSPYGIKFDHTLIELIAKKDVEKILNLNPEFCEEAGECGLRSIIITLGMISQLRTSFKQSSYEGPLGIGHLVGYWKVG